MLSDVVQSVDRALSILELLVEHKDGLRIMDISKKLNLHKSTVHRLLNTLIYRDYVEQDEETAKYYVSLKIFELGNKKISNMDFVDVAKPYAVKLMKEVNEIVHIVVRKGTEILYLDKVQADNPIKVSSSVGERKQLYSTAVGRAILCNMKDDELEDILNKIELKKFTEHTKIDKEELLEELHKSKKRGYAIDDEENEPGIRCAGSVILGHSGEIVGAISISGPTFRITKENVDDYGKKVSYYASLISKDLGYSC